ncbi:dihydropteroate synthase [uncultured Desulfobacter sp.]|uniref:dihydropteroate synthase n=1 Tax=uncultured Desulfobacter sp. TaxID=240139 RepID=UPI002AAB5185|nr:dihydropteroate synthase [uncultured Desulfobacter sp.]
MTTTNFTLECGRFKLDLGPTRACVMGILNTTPDSFSDGGKYTSLDKALTRALEMVEAGAHILDIGGESSRPFARPVSEQEELDRTIPVIEAIAGRIGIPISIDTVKSRVAKEALAAGGAIINDISAFENDPAMVDVAVETGAPAILMHMKGTPETMQVNPSYNDLMGEIISYLQKRVAFATEKGMSAQKIILDPGIGFGKTVAHNLVLIRELHQLTALGYPVLMGPSRKSFVQKVLGNATGKKTGPTDAATGHGNLAACAACLMNGAHIIRVHDVEAVCALSHVIDAIRNA